MHIDEVMAQLKNSPDQTVIIPANWAQGRTVYGGLTAALVYQSMQHLVAQDRPDEQRPIRYLNLSFIGPLLVNEPISVQPELLRAGRSATQLIVHVKQADKTCVIGQACFGIERPAQINIPTSAQHEMKAPKRANFIPPIPKVVPRFLRHVDINLQAGRMPFLRSKKDYLHGWMRFSQAPSTFTDAHLLALIDAWPCTVLQQLKKPAPASTMSWHVEFTQTATAPQTDDWLAYQATTAHAAGGYVFGDAHIWNQNGELLALSRQAVGVFA